MLYQMSRLVALKCLEWLVASLKHIHRLTGNGVSKECCVTIPHNIKLTVL